VRLAADVGGTKTALALLGDDGAVVREAVLASREHASLERLVASFLGDDRPRSACFAVAGPVRRGAAHLTNLDWEVDGASFPFEVRLLNDVEAMARAVSGLPSNVVLQEGESDPAGALGVIAPGTGLGFALSIEGHAAPSEAGHATFAPTNDRERAWCDYLAARFGRVSRERACSGGTYALLEEYIDGDARPMFAHMLGAIAGDWALSVCATGGLYVAGGMAPRVLPHPAFLDAFRDKGRFRTLAERIPVILVTDERAALKGAIAALPD